MPHHPDEPLKLSDPALADPVRLATWPERLPLIGGFVHFYAMTSRLRRAASEVDELLKQRSAFPAAAWHASGVDPAIAEPVAQAIARLVVREHPNHHYHPDDSLWMLMLDPENMAMVEASFVCKKQFGRAIDVRMLPPWDVARFIDFVRAVVLLVRQSEPSRHRLGH